MYLSILNDGGPLFMYPLLMLLILVIILIVMGFIKKQSFTKNLKLISSVSLFALVWGILGQAIGLITGFDVISQSAGISPQTLAAGLRISALSSAFGMVIFLIGRLGIIILTLIQKE